jgi:hypothetical protein
MVDDAVAKAVAAIQKPRDGQDGKDALQINVLPMLERDKSYARGTYVRAFGGTLRAFRNTDEVPAFKLGEDSWEKFGWEVCMNGIAGEEESSEFQGRVFTRTTLYTDGTKFSRQLQTEIQIYRGVWKEATAYSRGDTVSWDGSNWHCEAKGASEKPGKSDQWKLMVKSGRDGRDFDDPLRRPARSEPVRTK